MSTYISSNPNGEITMHENNDFVKQEFRYREAQSYKSILTDTTPAYMAQDISQKQTVECLLGKINSILQQEVRSDECKIHADTGETHYVPDVKLKEIWKEVTEKFGKRADVVKKRLLKAAGKNLSAEGYVFECEQSNTDQPDKWKLVRDVKNPNVGRSYLDRWLEEKDDEKTDDDESGAPAEPENQDNDIILPDTVQIPRQPQPEQDGTEE